MRGFGENGLGTSLQYTGITILQNFNLWAFRILVFAMQNISDSEENLALIYIPIMITSIVKEVLRRCW